MHDQSLSPTSIRYAITLLIIGLSTTLSIHANASSVYVGYGQSEQVSVVGERELDFTPSGSTALLSLDVSDRISVSADFYSADDSVALTERLNGEINIDSWSVSAGYFGERWSVSFSYVDWQDDLVINAPDLALTGLTQNTEAPSYSFVASYDWQIENWLVATGIGVHYSDWEMSQIRASRTAPPTSAMDEGSSTFISADVSASYFIPLSEQNSMIWGLSLRWNQLTDSESTAVSRNGRNISQISNRTVRNLINAQSALGSESYGKFNTYLSFDLSRHWILDLNASFDFGGEESSTAWAINLGYRF